MSYDWQSLLDAAVRQGGIVGAQLGVLRDGEITTFAAGSCNPAEGIDATPDALFQIGSITKVYTATMAMQLLQEGRLTLDDPLDVPGLPELVPGLTLRHLLTHTSGLDGDFFVETGPGDDCLERYVEELARLPPLHPLGATFSYCNAGFVVLGRVIELLDGRTWDASLQARIARRIGLTRTETLVGEVIRHRVAVGHVAVTHGGPVPIRPWGLYRNLGPSGLVCAPAADVLAFVRAHLEGTLLDATVASAMREPLVAVPEPWTVASHQGLGWALHETVDGGFVIGHDGATGGQNAFLRVCPERGVAVYCVLNGGVDGVAFRDAILGPALRLLADVTLATAPEPSPELAVDEARFLGRYRKSDLEVEIVRGPAGLELRSGTQAMPLYPLTPTALTTRPARGLAMAVVGYDVPGGGRHLHFAGRTIPEAP